jgi:hypothetical protein
MLYCDRRTHRAEAHTAPLRDPLSLKPALSLQPLGHKLG